MKDVSDSYNRSQQDALFLNFILINSFTCFGQTCCQSQGVLILYSQQLVFIILVMLTVCFQIKVAKTNLNTDFVWNMSSRNGEV